nr:helix-turn-helix domain-containing protein [Nocardioides marinus]
MAAIPEIARDPALVLDLHASTRAQFQIFLSLLERPAQEVLLPPQAVDLALSLARRQLDLGVLLQVYRSASSAVWEYFTEVVRTADTEGLDRTDLLVYLWSHGGAWINGAVEQLIGVFSAEREATLQGAIARRSEVVHAILRGEQVSLTEATTALGHPVRDQHTAVVLWEDGEAAAPDVLTRLSVVVNGLGADLAASVLSIPAGRAEVWAWLTSRQPIGATAVRAAVTELLQGRGEDDGSPAGAAWRIAVGCPGAGVAGLRHSHREAVDAQRHALGVASDARWTAYADVELAALVAGNEAGARRLVERELGGLADPDPSLDRLRETVAAFLAHGASVELAAAELFVHKNTVRYRVARAEELLGHPLSQRRTEVAVALACLERFGTGTGGWFSPRPG